MRRERDHRPATSRAPAHGADLLLDFAEAARRLCDGLAALRGPEDVLDAFLLAGCLHQILEDHLHRDLCSLGRAAERLPRVLESGAGRRAAATVRGVRSAGVAVRTRTPVEKSLVDWGRRHSDLVLHLARAVVDGATLPGPNGDAVGGVERLPAALRRTVGRLPHCFRSFDLQPADVGRLVDLFAERWPERTAPVTVVGLRTAGSYLAPLAAAWLEARGYKDSTVLTVRPGQDWLDYDLEPLRAAVTRDSRVLVVDEPPRSGSQFLRAAGELEELGVRRDSLVLLVPLFGSEMPTGLCAYPTVSLPWQEWAIHERLAPGAVQTALGELLPACQVEHVEPVRPSALPEPPHRAHVTSVFKVRLTEKSSGTPRERHVAVEGTGLGYLGRHIPGIDSKLGGFLPPVHGFQDGLLYREWLPEEWRATPQHGGLLASRIASYVASRNQALAVSEDMTRRMVGRDTVADLVAQMLGDAFGRAGAAVRPLVQHLAWELLAPRHPSVVDGSMTLDHWFAPPDDAGAALKVDFHGRAFSNEDRYCYDPVYDLATAAASAEGSPLAQAIVSAYEQLCGETVEPERWFLYRLLHHWYERRNALAGERSTAFTAAERAMARVHQQYFAERFASDLSVPVSGPLCALDVDWVLEVRWLGFPAISPAAALALRSLARHGYRAVLATGRSLTEVRERCRAYRLAGGVAEYGAVVYDHVSNRTRSLVSAENIATLAELADRLRKSAGVHVDPARRHSVRAFRLERSGTVGLDSPTIEAALSRIPGGTGVTVIPARSQTDFVIADVDKSHGVRALAQELGETRVALAVGDSIHDLPMLQLAERAVAPANADAALSKLIASGGTGIERTSRPYGAGLLEAVSSVVGQPRPGGLTRAGRQTAGSAAELLLTALGALDGGAPVKARQAALLGFRLANPRRRRR